MKLRNLSFPALLIAVAGVAACGKAPSTAEVTPTALSASTTAAPSSETGAKVGDASGQLGVELYPGLEVLVAAHPIPGGPTSADFKSSDKPEKIAAFYRDLLSKNGGDNSQYLESPMGEGMFQIQASDGKHGISIMIRAEGDRSIVGIQTLRTANGG